MLGCECTDDNEFHYSHKEEVKHHVWQEKCDHCDCVLIGKPGLVISTEWSQNWKEDWWEEHCTGWNEDESEEVYSEEMPDSPTYYLCEPCGDLYESIQEKGFCTINIETMQEDILEWNEILHES